MKESAKTKKLSQKQKKIIIIVTAAVLLAATVFGIVWASIDHSFRYDKKDLTPYIGTINLEDIKNMNLSVETDISDEDIAKEIYELLTKSDKTGGLKENAKNFAKRNQVIKDGHAVYMYYQLYEIKKTGEGAAATTEKKLIASSTKFNNKDSATLFRIGSDEFCHFLEKQILDGNYIPEGKTDGDNVQRPLGNILTRNDTKEAAYTEGDTLVISLKGTYTVNGEEKTFYKKQSVFLQTGSRDSDVANAAGLCYYNADNQFIDNMKSDVDDNKSLTDKLLAELTGKKNGEKVSFTLPMYIAKDNTAPTEVSFEAELESFFNAEMFVMSWIKEGSGKGIDETLTITGDDGKKVELAVGSSVEFRFIVENTLSLNKETVTQLALNDNATDSDEVGFEIPEGIADTDEAYASAFETYTFERLRDAYIANLKTEKTYEATILNALWEEIYKKYTEGDGSVIKDYPKGEIDSYYKTAMNNYKYEYFSGSSASTYQKTYKSGVEEYILVKVYGKTSSEVHEMTEKEINDAIRSYIEADAKKQISRRLVLFSLAQANGITMDRNDRKGYLQEAQDSIEAYYRTIYSLYGSGDGTKLSEDQINLYAKNAAKAEVDAMTDKYIREGVYLDKVGALFLTNGDFPGVVFTRENSAADDGHDH